MTSASPLSVICCLGTPGPVTYQTSSGVLTLRALAKNPSLILGMSEVSSSQRLAIIAFLFIFICPSERQNTYYVFGGQGENKRNHYVAHQSQANPALFSVVLANIRLNHQRCDLRGLTKIHAVLGSVGLALFLVPLKPHRADCDLSPTIVVT